MSYAPDFQNLRDSLRTVKYEAMKLYRVYDVTNRLVTQYDAPTNAKQGDVCIRTDYAYDGTTARIVKMKESLQAWDSSWDI